MTDHSPLGPGELDLELGRAHSARIYDYLLGGKDNYPADRAVADASMEAFPALRLSAQLNREFMHRVVRFLAQEIGITQYLDLGTGIPTSPNLHEVVQNIQPAARIVYVDNDPIVLAHARALLVGNPRGKITFIRGDCREPQKILNDENLLDTLDFGSPIALTAIGFLHFIPDDDEAYRIVQTFVDALPAGSYLGLTSATDDYDPESGAHVREQYRAGGVELRSRTLAQVQQFFEGLELVDPGVVQLHLWKPYDTGSATRGLDPKDIGLYSGLGRKTSGG
jgi:SAM-dependent methyltransferase